MPTPTYIALANITLGSAASSVTFSNIPATPYRDLILVVSGSVTSSQGNNFLYFNGDTSAGNYYYIRLLGDGSNVSTATASTASVSDMTVSTQNQVIIQIMDFAATDKQKIRLSRSDQSTSTIIAYASKWANTARVTSLTFAGGNGGNLSAATTLSLYGIEG
jgi:hypothetical protein